MSAPESRPAPDPRSNAAMAAHRPNTTVGYASESREANRSAAMDDDEPGENICYVCNGSGESRWNTRSCWACGGSGVK